MKLPKNLNGKDKLVMLFRFLNEKNQKFGSALMGFIDLTQDSNESSLAGGGND